MTNLSEISDIEIVRLYRDRGDMNYLGELYKRYTKVAFVLCYKYLKDRDAAKEAVAQVFELLINALKKYNVDNFKSWLLTVCRNHCFFIIKNQKNIVEYCDFFENNVPEIVEFEDLFTQYDKEDREKMFDRLFEGINQLPEEQKSCIDLFYLKNKSYSEIISMTGFDFKQIKSYLQNGRRNLRNFLSKSPLVVFFVLLYCFNV